MILAGPKKHAKLEHVLLAHGLMQLGQKHWDPLRSCSVVARSQQALGYVTRYLEQWATTKRFQLAQLLVPAPPATAASQYQRIQLLQLKP